MGTDIKPLTLALPAHTQLNSHIHMNPNSDIPVPSPHSGPVSEPGSDAPMSLVLQERWPMLRDPSKDTISILDFVQSIYDLQSAFDNASGGLTGQQSSHDLPAEIQSACERYHSTKQSFIKSFDNVQSIPDISSTMYEIRSANISDIAPPATQEELVRLDDDMRDRAVNHYLKSRPEIRERYQAASQDEVQITLSTVPIPNVSNYSCIGIRFEDEPDETA